SGTQRISSSSMPVISNNNAGVQQTKQARPEQAIEAPVPQMASIEGSKVLSNISPVSSAQVSTPIDERVSANGNTIDQDERNHTPTSIGDTSMVDENPEYEDEPESSFITSSSTTDSRLHDIVSADLRQGGVLSKRLPG